MISQVAPLHPPQTGNVSFDSQALTDITLTVVLWAREAASVNLISAHIDEILLREISIIVTLV